MPCESVCMTTYVAVRSTTSAGSRSASPLTSRHADASMSSVSRYAIAARSRSREERTLVRNVHRRGSMNRSEICDVLLQSATPSRALALDRRRAPDRPARRRTETTSTRKSTDDRRERARRRPRDHDGGDGGGQAPHRTPVRRTSGTRGPGLLRWPLCYDRRSMRIALGADHAGVALKDDIKTAARRTRRSATPTSARTRPTRWTTRTSPPTVAHEVAAGRVRSRHAVLRLGHRHGDRGQQGRRHPRRAGRRRARRRASAASTTTPTCSRSASG